MNNKKIKVKIITNKYHDEYEKTCSWKSIESKYKDSHEFEFVNIAKYLEEKENSNSFLLLNIFDRKYTDIIIVNWNSINGDPITGSDKSFLFFKHYEPFMRYWVKKGGIIILEAQTVASMLTQNSYDIFCKDIKITKKTLDKRERFLINLVNTNLLKHPILTNFKNEYIPYRSFSGYWPPSESELNDIKQSNQIENGDKLLSQGWFEKYPSDCNPLIFIYGDTNGTLETIVSLILQILKVGKHSRRKSFHKISSCIEKNVILKGLLTNARKRTKKPVMLCRIVGSAGRSGQYFGAYIITTMYIGASSLPQLIDNLLYLSSSLETYQLTRNEAIVPRWIWNFITGFVEKMFVFGFVIFAVIIGAFVLNNKVIIATPTKENSYMYLICIGSLSLMVSTFTTIMTVVIPKLKERIKRDR